MRIKPTFELISTKIGPVENMVNISRETLKITTVDKADSDFLEILVKGFSKAKGSGDFVVKNMYKCVPVRLPNYPIPGFVTKSGIPCINLSVLTSEHVSDYSAADIFSMYMYSLSLASFFKNRPFDKNVVDVVSDFLFNSFMKLFGKKFGLHGSYQYLIPSLQSVIYLYTHVAFMGGVVDNALIKNVSNRYYTDISDLNINFDLSSTKEMFKCLRINNIAPITENVFSTTILNVAGISSVPLFEDISRFFATICASSVAGSNVYSSYFRKVNPRLFDRVLDIGVKSAKKGNF